MTTKSKTRQGPARPARAQVRFISRQDCDGCVCCRNDDHDLRLTETMMPQYPPVADGLEYIADDAKQLVLCENCIDDAARTLGLFQSTADDPDVRRLTAAAETARESYVAAQLEEASMLERLAQLEAEMGH
jgi:hypothetical protein